MSLVEEKRKKRFLFLNALYETVDGKSESRIVNMLELGESIGMNLEETNDVVGYLSGESLLKHKSLGGGIAITHFGVREVENATSKRHCLYRVSG